MRVIQDGGNTHDEKSQIITKLNLIGRHRSLVLTDLLPRGFLRDRSSSIDRSIDGRCVNILLTRLQEKFTFFPSVVLC